MFWGKTALYWAGGCFLLGIGAILIISSFQPALQEYGVPLPAIIPYNLRVPDLIAGIVVLAAGIAVLAAFYRMGDKTEVDKERRKIKHGELKPS